MNNRQLYALMQIECSGILAELERLEQVFTPPVEASPGMRQLYKRLAHIRALLEQEKAVGPWPSPVAELAIQGAQQFDYDRQLQQVAKDQKKAQKFDNLLRAYRRVNDKYPWE